MESSRFVPLKACHTAGKSVNGTGLLLVTSAYWVPSLCSYQLLPNVAADVASITGTNFSSWYEQSKGTVFADVTRENPVPLTDFPAVWYAFNGTNIDDSISMGYLTEGLGSLGIRDGGGLQSNLFPGSLSGVRRRIMASAYKNSDTYVIYNADTAQAKSSSGTVPSNIAKLNIGCNLYNVYQLNGTIRRVTYWPTRLSNNTLQTITQ